ncbi:MAG: nucleoside-diphosphate kinase [Phycisphaerae bacterium]
MQTTLVILKPDCVDRGLAGEVIRRFEAKGLKIAGMKMMKITRQLAEKHYAEHVGKGFFEDLVAFMTGSPVVVLAVRGPEAIGLVRTLMGKTKFTEAAPGTIRGDYAHDFTKNLVHGSDSEDSAQRELGIFFADGETF